MLKNEDLQINLNRVQDWIKATDQKIGILLTLQTALLTLFFYKFYDWFFKNQSHFDDLLRLLILVGVASGIYSFWELVSGILPRLNSQNKNLSITYFGDISQMSQEDFLKKVDSTSDREFEKELVKQIYINSIICSKKMGLFRRSLISIVVFIATVLSMLAYINIHGT